MSVWVSLFLAAFLTFGLFFSLFMLVNVVVGGRKASANPRVGITKGDKEGSLGLWVNWKPGVFALEFYRIKVSYYAPESEIREGSFSVTFDSPRKAPFLQYVELPAVLKDLLTAGQTGRKAIITVEAKTVDNFVVIKESYLAQVKKIFLGQRTDKVPELEKFESVAMDAPPVASLDYAELVERKKKLKALTDAAKAKAAKAAAPKPAAPAAQPPGTEAAVKA